MSLRLLPSLLNAERKTHRRGIFTVRLSEDELDFVVQALEEVALRHPIDPAERIDGDDVFDALLEELNSLRRGER